MCVVCPLIVSGGFEGAPRPSWDFQILPGVPFGCLVTVFVPVCIRTPCAESGSNVSLYRHQRADGSKRMAARTPGDRLRNLSRRGGTVDKASHCVASHFQ